MPDGRGETMDAVLDDGRCYVRGETIDVVLDDDWCCVQGETMDDPFRGANIH